MVHVCRVVREKFAVSELPGIPRSIRACTALLMSLGLSSVLVPAGELTEAWVARYDGPDGLMDQATALAVAPAGTIYVVGGSATQGGFSDFSTVKYDPDGTELWAARETVVGYKASARDVVVDSRGSIWVAGEAASGNGQGQYVVAKYSPDSRFRIFRKIWAAGDFPRALAVDSEDSVIVTGQQLLPGAGEFFHTTKYEAGGGQMWVARFDGAAAQEDPTAIAVDRDDNVYVTGTSGPPESHDFLTVKYAPGGQTLWSNRYRGAHPRNDPRALVVDDDGNAYVSGLVYPDVGDFEVLCTTLKYGPDGQVLWIQQHEGTVASALDMALDSDGNVLIAGGGGTIVKYSPDGILRWRVTHPDASLQHIAVDPAGDIVVAGSIWQPDTGQDCIVLKYDSAGRQVGDAQFFDDDGTDQWLSDLAVDSEGNVYIAGWTELPPDGGDFFTVKYGPATLFVRGDCNGDGAVDLNDAVYHLEMSFVTGIDPACHGACDSNGDGKIVGQIVDPVYLLRFLFLSDRSPPPPFPECGTDPAGSLDCAAYSACQ